MREKYKATEQPRHERLQAHIANLKAKQAKVFDAPLRREDWQKLTPKERYHITQGAAAHEA